MVIVSMGRTEDRAEGRARAQRTFGRGRTMDMESNEARHLRAVYVISVAAELAGMHPQTLRIYERKGLVQPARTGGGSRRYSEQDIGMLLRIQELTNEGLNLAGVKRVLELEAENERLRRHVADLERTAKEAVEQAHRQHRRDLVPLSQALERYGWRPPGTR